MILNRLVFPEGNDLVFNVDHYENKEKYILAGNEKYYILISEAAEPFSVVASFFSDENHFEVKSFIAKGEYVFEIGIIDGNGKKRIILPALDENDRPLNQMLILRRLEE